MPEDVRALAPDVLRHRVVLTFEAEAEDVDADVVDPAGPRRGARARDGSAPPPGASPPDMTLVVPGNPQAGQGASSSARAGWCRRSLPASTARSSAGRGWSSPRCAPTRPGDDFRTIDWNVSARLGSPYVKTFTEERELTRAARGGPVGLHPVRRAAHQGRARRRRWRRCSRSPRPARTTAWARCSSPTEVEQVIPPRKGRRHALRVHPRPRRLRSRRGGAPTSAASLTYAGRLLNHRSIVVILSDFLAPDWERPLRRLAGAARGGGGHGGRPAGARAARRRAGSTSRTRRSGRRVHGRHRRTAEVAGQARAAWRSGGAEERRRSSRGRRRRSRGAGRRGRTTPCRCGAPSPARRRQRR